MGLILEGLNLMQGFPKCSMHEILTYMYHMCQGLNSHYFHIIGDGHQPNNRGLYTYYKDSY